MLIQKASTLSYVGVSMNLHGGYNPRYPKLCSLQISSLRDC
jgi:hypothetical protein